jgi:serine/threonine protein kinase
VGATGTFAWMSPEALRGEEIGKDADLYSYGVVVWECATRDRPWANLQGKPQPLRALGRPRHFLTQVPTD